MPQTAPPQTDPPFLATLPWHGLLEILIGQGFKVGVAQTLRMEVLLRHLPPNTTSEHLKYLLAPLFVTSEAEQEKFYDLCDTFLASYKGQPEDVNESGSETIVSLRREPSLWLVVGVPLLLLILTTLSISLMKGHYNKHNQTNPDHSKHNQTNPDHSKHDQTNPTPISTNPQQVLYNSGNYQFPIEIRLHPSIPSYALDKIPGPTLWNRYGWKALVPTVLIPLMLIWLLARINRRRNIIKRRNPPFRWPLEVDSPQNSIHSVTPMLDTARHMKMRQTADYAVLDIKRSIECTINAGGFPTLSEQTTLRRPEYLVLIDRRSARDHLATFYAELVQTLKREGIHADYFYFDDDIRVCQREDSEDNVDLIQLTTRFAASHRLLIIADGECLLDPVTGHIPEWAVLFQKWKERALFLPEPLPEKSIKELEGQGRFWLFQANFQGLRDFPERLAGDGNALFDQREPVLDQPAPFLPETFSEEYLNGLKDYLGDTAFLWLCVCALYPELRWNLTHYLGALPSMPPETRSRENMLRLARLDWFRAGSIPEAWRWELMSRLDTLNPLIAQEAREGIVQLMMKSTPPQSGSYAEEGFLLELALQRWAANPTEEKRAELGAILREMQPDDILRRMILVRLLQTEKSRSFWRGLGLFGRKLVSESGVPELGPRQAAWIIAALLLIFLGCLALPLIHVAGASRTSPRSYTEIVFKQSGVNFGSTMMANAKVIFQNQTPNSSSVQNITIEQDSDAFALQGQEAFNVPTQKEKAIQLRFVPKSKGTFRAQIRFTVNGGHENYVVPLLGRFTNTTRVSNLRLPFILKGHHGSVYGVAFSRDSKQIVTGGEDNIAIIWDAVTGANLHTLSGHKNTVDAVAFSPDGQRIVTGSKDHTAIIWDAATGTRIRTLSGHTDIVDGVAYSPDGKQIVTGSWDHTAIIWDAATGKRIYTLSGHTDIVDGVAYSPDGKQIVTGSWDHTAIIWDAAAFIRIGTLSSPGDTIDGVAYSPDGKQIVTGSKNHAAIIWDAATGARLHTLAGHGNTVYGLVYSPDSQRIVTGSEDNTAIIWNAVTGVRLRALTGHKGRVYGVAYSPDGQRIVTGSWDRTAIIWDAVMGTRIRTLNGQSGTVFAAAFSPNNQQIVTGTENNTAIIWDASTGARLRILTGHKGRVYGAAFSPNSQQIVTGGEDHTAIIWNASTGARLHTLAGQRGTVLKGHTGIVWAASFSPDGKQIVTGSSDHTAIIWNAATGTRIRTLTGHSGTVFAASFSPDGKRIVTGSSDHKAIIWDASTGARLHTLTRHANYVHSASFSPDGKRIVTGSEDGTAIIWDASTGAYLRTLRGHTGPVHTASFSPDSQEIVTGSSDHTAIVWNAATGKPILSLIGHSGTVFAASFSPDGQQIVTGSSDHTAIIWEAPQLLIDGGQQRSPNASALLIGVGHYQQKQQFTPLLGTKKDLAGFSSILKNKFAVASENITVISEKQATHHAILQAMEKAGNRLQSGDKIIVYISGYGLLAQPSANNKTGPLMYYFVPYDGDSTHIQKTCLSGKELQQVLVSYDRLGIQTVLIVESCNSGALAHNITPNTILYAGASANQVVYETAQGGLFTHALTQCIQKASPTATWLAIDAAVKSSLKKNANLDQDPVLITPHQDINKPIFPISSHASSSKTGSPSSH